LKIKKNIFYLSTTDNRTLFEIQLKHVCGQGQQGNGNRVNKCSAQLQDIALNFRRLLIQQMHFRTLSDVKRAPTTH